MYPAGGGDDANPATPTALTSELCVLTFIVCGGLDKASLVIGPFFLVGSVLSVLRQTEALRLETEVPLLVILVGVLLLIAQMPFVPRPKWFVPLKDSDTRDRASS